MPCFVCFLNSMCNKNDPKIKVLRMPWKFYMIFSWIFKNFWCKNNQRGCTRWAQPTWAHQHPQVRPGGLWTPRGPPHLSLHPTSPPTSRKKSPLLSLMFLFSNPRILISWLEAPFPILFRGIVAWYVSPPLVQLVFSLVVYILNN